MCLHDLKMSTVETVTYVRVFGMSTTKVITLAFVIRMSTVKLITYVCKCLECQQ